MELIKRAYGIRTARLPSFRGVPATRIASSIGGAVRVARRARRSFPRWRRIQRRLLRPFLDEFAFDGFEHQLGKCDRERPARRIRVPEAYRRGSPPRHIRRRGPRQACRSLELNETIDIPAVAPGRHTLQVRNGRNYSPRPSSGLIFRSPAKPLLRHARACGCSEAPRGEHDR
jgi:hypothetical protein